MAGPIAVFILVLAKESQQDRFGAEQGMLLKDSDLKQYETVRNMGLAQQGFSQLLAGTGRIPDGQMI